MVLILKFRISNMTSETWIIQACPNCHHCVQVPPGCLPPIPAMTKLLCPKQVLSCFLIFLQERKIEKRKRERERRSVGWKILCFKTFSEVFSTTYPLTLKATHFLEVLLLYFLGESTKVEIEIFCSRSCKCQIAKYQTKTQVSLILCPSSLEICTFLFFT